MIEVSVAYAAVSRQVEIPLKVAGHCSVALAIKRSGVLAEFPEIPWPEVQVGIFGVVVTLDTVVKAGDRIEIYRPLQLDPKKARQLRARKTKRLKSV